MRLEISVLVDSLLSAGKTVVLIMPLLDIGFDLPQRWIENQIRAGKAIDEWKVEAGPGLTLSAFRNEIARILDRYRDNPHLVAVDPLSVVCEQRLLLSGPERAGQFPRHRAYFQRQCEPVPRPVRRGVQRVARVPGRKRRRKRNERRDTADGISRRNRFPKN